MQDPSWIFIPFIVTAFAGMAFALFLLWQTRRKQMRSNFNREDRT